MLGRGRFRVVHYSIQRTHVHLICEANDEACLTQGVAGLAIRLARAFNRVHGRKGGLWASRYHARILRTPREVRRAIVYVLGNWRHHGGQYAPRQLVDPCDMFSLTLSTPEGETVHGDRLEGDGLAFELSFFAGGRITFGSSGADVGATLDIWGSGVPTVEAYKGTVVAAE